MRRAADVALPMVAPQYVFLARYTLRLSPRMLCASELRGLLAPEYGVRCPHVPLARPTDCRLTLWRSARNGLADQASGHEVQAHARFSIAIHPVVW
jgi:hypothetical protein